MLRTEMSSPTAVTDERFNQQLQTLFHLSLKRHCLIVEISYRLTFHIFLIQASFYPAGLIKSCLKRTE